MTVLQSCHCVLPPTTRVRLHANTCPKLFASRLRLSSAEGAQQNRTNSITLKRKRVHHTYNLRSEQSAFTRTSHQAQQASTADASTERRPKVVGLGLACWDFLAQVAGFPKPDEKLRTQRMETRGGGNCANALTAASHLGADTYLVTKLGKDSIGDQIVSELEQDGVNTQFVLRDDGLSSFGYMIVDKQGGTRTSILTPGVEYTPQELQPHTVDAILEDASLVYFDGRLTDCAVLLAKAARQKGVPVLVEAERPREGLDELLQQADYLCTSTHFPKSFTGQDTLGDAMLGLLEQLPRVQWIITTLGKKGSVLVERASSSDAEGDAVLEDALNSMLTEAASSGNSSNSGSDGASQNGQKQVSQAACTSKAQAQIRAGSTLSSRRAYKLYFTNAPQHQQAAAAIGQGSGHDETGVVARITIATVAIVPQEAMEDTTGAGDSFIGSMLYGLTYKMPLDKAMQLGALVAACNCTALGARPALPYASDIDAQFLAGSDVFIAA